MRFWLGRRIGRRYGLGVSVGAGELLSPLMKPALLRMSDSENAAAIAKARATIARLPRDQQSKATAAVDRLAAQREKLKRRERRTNAFLFWGMVIASAGVVWLGGARQPSLPLAREADTIRVRPQRRTLSFTL